MCRNRRLSPSLASKSFGGGGRGRAGKREAGDLPPSFVRGGGGGGGGGPRSYIHRQSVLLGPRVIQCQRDMGLICDRALSWAS